MLPSPWLWAVIGAAAVVGVGEGVPEKRVHRREEETEVGGGNGKSTFSSESKGIVITGGRPHGPLLLNSEGLSFPPRASFTGYDLRSCIGPTFRRSPCLFQCSAFTVLKFLIFLHKGPTRSFCSGS